uniref:Uncharacterized protein n=1 Tax=Polytomella parva TaxID=51329 RepID=A0A7S0UVR7_9CHLO|nr:putative sodium/metabolite cotransporter (BASS4) [Polytomella parva]|mmetsp:Transcript_20021/g.36006  ORF Transcript_20021/g.36006 Transcript_20021/m.36006 type:complete len:476 (+) Transcript_20021:147-1574(+)|eukprot:CAMPEP_0175071628 /NCGR_PEP_ID=MMETSP0052_2-20121109/19350_1 /TAXON_ID=51329 ORGANISM="Polytomella parva, Strain SAG 63-3" /NCGR_SAMPLE_ID=MMETSP0052_2 /ASSEMBLY_ACC=CAM_ASM_000194 /LENGTH=475 /DNA_ID=CAMNT_0016338823 /DNA_START=87 /DNA_END=1514 /DNA_ORIENTATION=+
MVEVQGGKLKKFLVKNFLTLGFIFSVIFGLACPAPGHHLYDWKSKQGWKIMTTINLCIIFFIFGLTLETKELVDALKGYKTLILGIISTLVITALTGFIFVNMDFSPKEFGYGLAIFACSPTSLSAGVTCIIQGYGNAALGLMITVLTNILAIFITPLFVTLILSSKIKNIQVDSMDLLLKLGVSICIPIVAGKVARDRVPKVLDFAKKYKTPLYLFNNFQIICIVWMTLSHSQHELLEQRFYDILFAIMGAIGQHFFFLAINVIIAYALPFVGFRIPDAERKAFIISASQKSLPTAAVIISYMPSGDEGLGDLGLVAIPCIVFYIMQLFIDSFIAQGWASKYEKGQALTAKYADQLAALADEHPNAPSLVAGTAADKASLEVGGTQAIVAFDSALSSSAAMHNSEKDSLLGGSSLHSDAISPVPPMPLANPLPPIPANLGFSSSSSSASAGGSIQLPPLAAGASFGVPITNNKI